MTQTKNFLKDTEAQPNMDTEVQDARNNKIFFRNKIQKVLITELKKGKLFSTWLES